MGTWEEACRKRLRKVGLLNRFDAIRKRWSVKGDGALSVTDAFNEAWKDFKPAVEALEALPDSTMAAELNDEAAEMEKAASLEGKDYTGTSIHAAMRWAVQHMGLTLKKEDAPSPLANEMLKYVNNGKNRSKVLDLSLKLAQMEDDGKSQYSDDGRGYSELLDDAEKAFLGSVSVLSVSAEDNN